MAIYAWQQSVRQILIKASVLCFSFDDLCSLYMAYVPYITGILLLTVANN